MAKNVGNSGEATSVCWPDRRSYPFISPVSISLTKETKHMTFADDALLNRSVKYTSIFVDDNGEKEATVKKALVIAMCSRWKIQRGMNDKQIEAIMHSLFVRINKVLELGSLDTRRASSRLVQKLIDSGDPELWESELKRQNAEDPASMNALLKKIGFVDIVKSDMKRLIPNDHFAYPADSLELSE